MQTILNYSHELIRLECCMFNKPTGLLYHRLLLYTIVMYRSPGLPLSFPIKALFDFTVEGNCTVSKPVSLSGRSF